MIFGQDKAIIRFRESMDSGSLHHAWLLAGPQGVGKASFAHEAATRLLASAAGPVITLPGIETPLDHPIARYIAAGSHPDFRSIKRLVNDKGDGLKRNISVNQIREIGNFFANTTSLSPWRAVIIDSVDDLENEGANALLKMLEEPPANTLFLLVSHAPGRLLPTIRSRCRRLDFQTLSDDAIISVLDKLMPTMSMTERNQLVARADGSIGQAIAYVNFDLAILEESAVKIMRQGDPDNSIRSKLSQGMSNKASAPRYNAFLQLIPHLIAKEARTLEGRSLERALNAYAEARETAAIANRLSLDPMATIFQLGGAMAKIHQ